MYSLQTNIFTFFKNYFSSYYHEVMSDFLKISIFIMTIVDNKKVNWVSEQEFSKQYFFLFKKYSQNNKLKWLKLILDVYFKQHLNYFFFSLKNLTNGTTFWNIWGETYKYYTVIFSVYYKSVFESVEYVLVKRWIYTPYNIFFLLPNPTSYRPKFVINHYSLIIFQHFYIYYKALRTLIFPALVSVGLLFFLVNYFSSNILRQLSGWLVVGFIFFWLISGFNFFLKRYRFGKFTSAIQRFWKRANTYFWLVEGFLFSLFFYYYLNSSQEPLYMYDESALNQTYLFSLINAYFSYILLVFLIFYLFFLLLNMPNFIFKQQLIHLTVISLLLIYIYLLENYQFYYVLTSFIENFWLFDAESNTWALEFEAPRLRVKHQYLILALIAKYWHFLFIFLSWLFFVVKSFEIKKIFYPLFGVNIQNILILFLLNILFYVQWVKWFFKRFYDVTYYWFFVDPNHWSIYFVFDNIFNFFNSVVCCCSA